MADDALPVRPPDATDASEAARYRRIAALGAAIPLVLLGVLSALQSTLFQAAKDLPSYGEIYDVPLWARLVANLSAAAMVTFGVWFTPIRPQRRVLWLSAVGVIGVLAVVARAVLQLAFGVYQSSQVDLVVTDIIVGLTLALFSLILGVALAEALRREREQERAITQSALRAQNALDALQSEELRIRREVAEGLHGTLQQRLVMLGARLRGSVEGLPIDAVVRETNRQQLEEIEREIDELREQGVREMSQLLYPEGINLGLAPAVRMMLRRVPPTIRVHVEIDSAVIEYDDPAHGHIPQTVRLLAVRMLEEAVSNALRHGHAGHIAVAVRVSEQKKLIIVVDDDGSGIPEGTVLSGLDRLRGRIQNLGGTLDIDRSALGGTQLAVRIPLE